MIKPAIFKGLVKFFKVCTSKYLFSLDTAEVDERGVGGGEGDNTGSQTETKDETTEHSPDLPLSTVVVTEDRMADHEVTEDGDTDRNEPVPRGQEHREEDKPRADWGRSKLVPRRLENSSDCHGENVGKAIQDYGGVEAGPILASDDGSCPEVDGSRDDEERHVGPGVGQGARLVDWLGAIGEEGEVSQQEEHSASQAGDGIVLFLSLSPLY